MAQLGIMALLNLKAGEGELYGSDNELVKCIVERIVWRLHSSTCSAFAITARAWPEEFMEGVFFIVLHPNYKQVNLG